MNSGTGPRTSGVQFGKLRGFERKGRQQKSNPEKPSPAARSSAVADVKIIMFNLDAVPSHYVPEPQDKEYFVMVDIDTGVSVRVTPSPML